MPKPPDRVQIYKDESSAGGGDGADSDPFGLISSPLNPVEDAPEVAGLRIQEDIGGGTSSADDDVGLYRESDKLVLHDTDYPAGITLATLAAGGGGLTEPSHRNLDTLVHNIAETSYQEIIRSGNDVTNVIYWTDNGKTEKILEASISRSSGKVSQVVIERYSAGILEETLTGDITRTSGKVSSIDWVLS